MIRTAVTISSLTVSDKEQAKEVLLAAYHQYEESYTNPEAWAEYRKNIATSLDNPNIERVLVAKEGQQILGSLQLFASSEKAYGLPKLAIEEPIVRLLAVHPNARGKGVAKQLLKESISYAKKKGARRLYLHTTDKMVDAIHLYEKLGFKRAEDKEFTKHGFLVKCYYFEIGGLS